MVLEHRVWQVAGGPQDRSYEEVFLRHGVALIGPGDPGSWCEDRADSDYGGSYVRIFANDMADGDVVLLRTGQRGLVAIGLVVGEYQHLPQFDDVNGWDIQHARRVRWRRLPEHYNLASNAFGANPRRVSRVWQSDILDYVKRFLASPPTSWQTASLPVLPPVEPFLDPIPGSLRGLVAQAQDLEPLYWQPHRFGKRPAEDEMIVHFVVPLLIALGWPPERIAVQWNKVDICVFSHLPRAAESCFLLFEAKRLGKGVEGAVGQARGYAESLSLYCDVVVTDGIRYRLYERSTDYQPAAYANLTRLKRSATLLFQRLSPSR